MFFCFSRCTGLVLCLQVLALGVASKEFDIKESVAKRTQLSSATCRPALASYSMFTVDYLSVACYFVKHVGVVVLFTDTEEDKEWYLAR